MWQNHIERILAGWIGELPVTHHGGFLGGELGYAGRQSGGFHEYGQPVQRSTLVGDAFVADSARSTPSTAWSSSVPRW